MNLPMYRALLLDATYQVLDNKMFRLLVLLVLALVVPFFLIQFRETDVSALFGLYKFAYETVPPELFDWGGPHAKETAIQDVQEIFVEFLAGSVGTLFCIAATAFFMPDMLEKGSADTAFSKPVRRGVLLLARYVSGILFVAALASVLIFGIYAGLRLASGHHDPGFLWSIVTLVYLFAIFHAVSIMVGILTRSSVTAILATLLLFVFCATVQFLWVARQNYLLREQVVFARADSLLDGEEDPRARGGESGGGGPMWAALEVAHHLLPKTMDADVIARKLRLSLEPDPEYADSTGLAIRSVPEGFERADAAESLAVWTAMENGVEVARYSLGRESRRTPDGKLRSTLVAARELAASLATSAGVVGAPVEVRLDLGGLTRTRTVLWEERRGAEVAVRARHFFSVKREWMYELGVTAQPGWLDAEQRTAHAGSFLHGFELPGAESSYAERVGFGAEPRYNLSLSIATSLGFAALALLVGWWRLARLDF